MKFRFRLAHHHARCAPSDEPDRCVADIDLRESRIEDRCRGSFDEVIAFRLDGRVEVEVWRGLGTLKRRKSRVSQIGQ